MPTDPPAARFHGRVPNASPLCAHAGCVAAGEFRAPIVLPQSSDNGPQGYRWLCLDHVRAFNQSYNYFAGMSQDEIYAAQTPHAGWERETRAFAHVGADRPPSWADFNDPLDAISTRFAQRAQARSRQSQFSAAENTALTTLGIAPDADRRGLRTAYTRLVRRYHPDHNGGDRSYEQRLQAVINAYALLRKSAAFA